MYGIFRTSYIQTKIAGIAAHYLSKELGTEIKIGGLDISWFLNIELEEVTIKDLKNENLLSADRIWLDVGKVNIKRKYLGIYGIAIYNANIDIIRYRSDSLLNFKFFADYFGSSKKPVKDSTAIKWKIGLSGVKLSNASFSYSDQLKDSADIGIDYNYLALDSLDLDLRRLKMDGQNITGNVSYLNFNESSGFKLSLLSAEMQVTKDSIVAKNLQIKTPESDLHLNLKFSHKDYTAYSDFVNEVRINALFDQSSLRVSDLGYFASELSQINEVLKIHGPVSGTISSLKAKKIRFGFGKYTYFEGDINMDGLPDIAETFIHLNIKDFRTNYKDIIGLSLPDGQPLEVPEQVKNLGNIRIKGFFTGFFYDFVSAATFTTDIGKITTDVSLKTVQNNKLFYKGLISIIDWDLGKSFDAQEQLGKLDFDSEIAGSYHQKTGIVALLKGKVNSMGLMGNEFNDIKLEGKFANRLFNGTLALRDELVDLDFNGLVDFSADPPVFNFTSTVENAYLSRLNLIERDSSAKISTTMDLNFTGSNIDNLLGFLKFTNTYYTEKGITYPARIIELATTVSTNNTKNLTLVSDFADINFSGLFTFADFYSSLINILNAYLPSLRTSPSIELAVKQEHVFDYSIQIKDVNPITELFLPDLKINSSAYLFGSYNSVSKTILLNGQADQFDYKGITINNWYIRGQNEGNSLQLITGSSAIDMYESDAKNSVQLGLENFSVETLVEGDSIRYMIKWKDGLTGKRNFGKIEGYFSFSEKPYIKAMLQNADFAINDTSFSIAQVGEIIIDSTSVFINNLHFDALNQDMKVEGKISSDPNDILNISFENLNISNADLLLSQEGLDFDGFLNGNISIEDLYGTQKIQADVSVMDFAFNKERLGDAFIITRWNYLKEGLEVNADVIYKGNIGTHKPISVTGYIYPEKGRDNNFDLDLGITNFNLVPLNPFLKGFASGLKGYSNGKLRLEGTFSEPAFSGNIELLRTQVKIDYLNVIYSLADKVEVKPDLISASGVIIYDSLGNTGLCNFRLSHKFFRDMRLYLDLQANNLSGLHTSFKDNELFYGNAVASGNVNISGPFDDLRMVMKVKSEKGTNIFIPINLNVDATENKYIKFVNTDEQEEKIEVFEPVTSGINLDMQIDVTKDAGIQIFLPEDIGNIKANGNGKIQMGIDTRGEITTFGDYNIESGTFLFTFQNIINRLFLIEQGSKISFNGSPYEADLNVKAVYKIRASLGGIPELASNPDYAGRNVPVDCIIYLKNNLYNPDIAFSIRLPDVEDNLRQLVFAAIDTTNDVVMTQQMVSLLLLKSFSFTGNTGLAGSFGASSLELLTSQLSGMLSQISKDVDIGLNYRSGDALTSEAVEVALSTHLFDDRVTIDGNFGLINSGSTQNTSNIIGDVVIDVKITRDGRFRVKAYNKSNNPFEVTSYNANYKQGVGIYYRYEFDKFSEIFRSQKASEVKFSPR
ncbi:MAG: translocation/assembly module TamB [Lentimicrobium sp.]|nr:translocation/assembly module TamB [Lentimicrobium sp.]